MRPSAEEVIALLGLKPLPAEGGFYAETHRSSDLTIAPDGSARSLATSILYLLTAESISALHRLRGDEVYHFYLGDPVELLTLPPGGPGEVTVLGHGLLAGQRVQHTVPAGTWQGSRLVPGGAWALLGTTMAPGYDPADFELADARALAAAYPAHSGLIAALAPGT